MTDNYEEWNGGPVQGYSNPVKKVVDWGWAEFYAKKILERTGKTLKIEVERKGYDKKNQHAHNDVNDFRFYIDGKWMLNLFSSSFDVMEAVVMAMERMAEALSDG